MKSNPECDYCGCYTKYTEKLGEHCTNKECPNKSQLTSQKEYEK